MLNKILQVTIRTKMLQEIARLTTLQIMVKQMVEYFSFHFREEPAVCLFQNRKLQFKLNLNKRLKQLMWFQG
jgi:hypothetical protein